MRYPGLLRFRRTFVPETCFQGKNQQQFLLYQWEQLYRRLYRDLSRGLLYLGHTGDGRLVTLEFFVLA